jgi:hypothetical protein
MGREVRKVPADWQHPKDERGYIPLHGRDCGKEQQDWDAGLALWIRGLRDDWKGGTVAHGERADAYGWKEWSGRRPCITNYMPDWPAEQRTHLMMYESVSEGTPVSPAFATPEELARWLADHGDGSGMHRAAGYEQWLAVARGGYAPSMVMDSKGLRSGVDAAADLAAQKDGGQ